MPSFNFFADAGLTTPASLLDIAASVDGSTGAVTRTVYYGSPSSGRTLRAAANPGIADIVVSITDSAPSSGSPIADITLALEPLFSGRIAGQALSLGAVINSGVGNALPIYIRWLDSTAVIGVNTDLSLVMTECEET